MFGFSAPARQSCQRSATLFLAVFTLCLLPGCSTLDNIQKTREVFDSLQEADRQFSLEDTPVGSVPNDNAATVWIKHALVLMPNSSVPYDGDDEDSGLIDILQNRGRYPLLITLLKAALAHPKLSKDPGMLLALGDAQQRMGEQSEATVDYAEALQAINSTLSKAGTTFDPDATVLIVRSQAEYYGGQKTKAIADLNTIISTQPDTAAEARNNLAYYLALDNTNLPYALKLAKLAVASARADGDDETVGIYEDTLAWVLHQQGDNGDALFYEQDAASLTPLEADVQYHLGEIYQAEGQSDEARAAYTRALKLDPFFPAATRSLQSCTAALSTIQPTT